MEQFVDKIRNIKIEEDETMVSFDISNMYPSLPKQYVMAKVGKRINDENFNPSMNNKTLIELVTILVEFLSFPCSNQYYCMMKKMDYLLVHDRHQNLQNFIDKELKKFMLTECYIHHLYG